MIIDILSYLAIGGMVVSMGHWLRWKITKGTEVNLIRDIVYSIGWPGYICGQAFILATKAKNVFVIGTIESKPKTVESITSRTVEFNNRPLMTFRDNYVRSKCTGVNYPSYGYYRDKTSSNSKAVRHILAEIELRKLRQKIEYE